MTRHIVHYSFYDLRGFFLIIIGLTCLPLPYLYFKIAHYGFGLRPLGTSLWLLPLFFIFILYLRTGGKVKSEKSRVYWKYPFDKIYLTFSWVAALSFIVETFVIRHPPDLGILELQAFHALLGDGEIQPLSVLGKMSLLLSGFAFLLIPRAIERKRWTDKFLYFMPSIIIVFANALMGFRQVLMFFGCMLLFTYLLKTDIKRKYLKVGFFAATLLTGIVVVGITRLGYTATGEDIISRFMLSLAITTDSVDLPSSLHAVLVYLYLYAGNTPESLSIFTSVAEPNWILFSHTNTLLYNTLGGIYDAPSYEHELRYLAQDPYLSKTGYFSRVWASGHLQLYLEGGLFYIFSWYFLLFIWFKLIVRCAELGKDILPTLALFCSLICINMLVFPLREPTIFIAAATIVTFSWIENRWSVVVRTAP